MAAGTKNGTATLNNITSYSDQELLTAMALDSQPAFDVIFSRYWKAIYNYAWRRIQDEAGARELVHDIFMDIWQRRHTLAINNLEAYLKTAIKFRVINSISRDKTPAFFELFDSLIACSDRPDARLLEKDITALIESWINALPEKRRKIFVRHFFDQLSTKEIALSLNMPQKTVQNQLTLTVKYLQTRFSHLLSLAIFFCL